MDTRTPAQKKTAARNHHLAGLYHNAFFSDEVSNSNPEIGTDVSGMDANSLVRNGWAMIHCFVNSDGSIKTVLGQSKTGSKKYNENRVLSTRLGESIIPRYTRASPAADVDMSVLMNMATSYSAGYLTRWY